MRIECQNRIRSQGHGIQTQNSLSGHLCSPLSYFCLFLLNDKDKTAGRERRDRKRDRSKVWINLDFSFTQDIRRLHSGFCSFFDGCCSKNIPCQKQKVSKSPDLSIFFSPISLWSVFKFLWRFDVKIEREQGLLLVSVESISNCFSLQKESSLLLNFFGFSI